MARELLGNRLEFIYVVRINYMFKFIILYEKIHKHDFLVSIRHAPLMCSKRLLYFRVLYNKFKHILYFLIQPQPSPSPVKSMLDNRNTAITLQQRSALSATKP